MAVVKGTALWAAIQSPRLDLDPPQWCIDVVLEKDDVKRLEAEGLTIGKKESGERFLRCKRNVYRKKDGGKNSPPLVVDARKQEFLQDIGNGSTVKVQYKTWNWNYKGKKGMSADLIAVQVLEYVAPPDSAGGEFDEEDGFIAEDVQEITTETNVTKEPF